MPKHFTKLAKGHLSLVLVVLSLAGYFVWQFFGGAIPAEQTVKASSADHNLSGWAWSDMPDQNDEEKNPSGGSVGRGMGWISFNSANHSGGADYGVNVKSNGDLEGYAWAENLAGLGENYNGWISFKSSDLTGCPSGACKAHLDRVSGVVSGWARALANTDSWAGGWDGWISLSGANYGVSVSGCNWAGLAWGGDIFGWINFANAGANDKPVLGEGDACVEAPTGVLTVEKAGAGSGTVNFDPPDSISYYPLPHQETYNLGREVVLTPKAEADSVFSGWHESSDEDCIDDRITMNSDKTCVAQFDFIGDAPPACPVLPSEFSVFPTTIIRGGRATLSWGRAQNANSCRINPGNINANCEGGVKSVDPLNTTDYWLNISGPSGSPVDCGPVKLRVRSEPPPVSRRPWWREILPW